MMATLVLTVGMLATVTLIDVGNRKTDRSLAREGANNLVREIVERTREIPYASLTRDANRRPAPLLALPGLGTAGGAGTWTITDRRGTSYTVTVDVCEIDDLADGPSRRDPATFCDVTNGGAGPGGSGAGTYSSVYADLAALGLNINVDLTGAGIQPLCNILGANPSLNSSLGGLAALVGGGADVRLCGTSSSSQVPFDPNGDDLKRVVTTVSWSRLNSGSGSVTHSTLIPNPAGGAPIT
jgi:hypothetical protein